MPTQESLLIEFITGLPPDVNPYLATAQLLETAIRPPHSPPWSRCLTIATLFFYVPMFFQAVYLLYQRLRISRSFKIEMGRNSLGLVTVNISYNAALACFFYAPLTIYVLCAKIATDMGHPTKESITIIISDYRFFSLVIGSWGFLWFCACHCALVLWNSSWASNMNRDKLQRLIKWCSYSFFLCATFGPLPFLSCFSAKAYMSMHDIESIAYGIISNLRAKAETYDPVNSSLLSILSLVSPAEKFVPLQENLAVNLRRGLYVYCVDISLLVLIYIPMLSISLRALYLESINAALGPDNQPKKVTISRKLRRDRRRLVYHALCVFCSTVAHLPLIIWLIAGNMPGILNSATRNQIAQHGLTIPMALPGNLMLLVLNIQSSQILRARKSAEKRRPSSLAIRPDPKSLKINSNTSEVYQHVISTRLFYHFNKNKILLDGLEERTQENVYSVKI